MPTEFEVGAGVRWKDENTELYGTVIRRYGDIVEMVPTWEDNGRVVCYDEGGSIRKRDENHVRLRDCPPPFTNLCKFAEKSCFVQAGADDRLKLPLSYLKEHDAALDDDGAKVSDRDMSEIMSRVWRDEAQHGKPVAYELSPRERMFQKAALDSARWASRERDGRDGPDFS